MGAGIKPANPLATADYWRRRWREVAEHYTPEDEPEANLYTLLEIATRARDRSEREKNSAYNERNRVVALLASLAMELGWKAGLKRTAIEGWDAAWHNCVYIDLPIGQVSWHYHDSEEYLFMHLPRYFEPWDGHDTAEKYERVRWQSRDSAKEAQRARRTLAPRD